MTLARRSVLTGMGALAWTGAAWAEELEPGVSLTHYDSRGVTIPTVLFEPVRSGGAMRGAGILLLHGGGGAQIDVPRFYRHAVNMTEHGFVVAMPNYFAGTPGGGDVTRSMSQRFRDVVADGATWLGSRPGMDPARLGMMGYSRGGHLATEVAVTTADVRAAVGVASAGSLATAAIRRRPQVMLIYASGDPVVRPRFTRRWGETLRAGGVPVTLRELDTPRHIFEEAEWSDIFSTARSFLSRHLV